MTTKKIIPQGMDRGAILALADKLYAQCKAHVAAGKPVTQEDIAAMNRARKVLKPRKANGNQA